ncbi:MAG TPA: hypothetical protein VFS10_06060 [Pyrinomonadaceae bacterium]|nr:hypothetical protein [Pyrinomonadaceae bacterium]
MRNSSNSITLAAHAFVVVLLALVAGSPLAAVAQTKATAKQGAAPANDIRIRVRMSVGEQSFESVEYVRGSRQRTEMSMAGGYKTIMQCDLKRYVQINDQSRTYMVQPFGGNEAGDATTQDAALPGAQKRGGVVTIVNTLVDTGERKQMFGYTARRLKGSMEYQASPDACQKGGNRMETDGWYIDLKYGVDCPAAGGADMSAAYRRAGCRDEIRMKQVGTAKMGYPLLVTTKMFNEDGSFTTTTREVVELSRAPLDPALFEVPEGYTEAKDYAQMSGAAAAAARADEDDETVGANSQAGSANGAQPQSATATASQPLSAATLGPKKPGVVRIGVVMPKAQMGQGASGMDVATPVRNTLVQYLSGPAVEIAVLDARVPQQAELEAREKECDYVLYTGVVQKKGGGGFGGLLKKAAPVASLGGYGGHDGAVAAHVTTTAIYTAADVSSAVKAKDEITFDFKLMPAGGGSTPKAANTLKAKAKHDGEDVLTPLIEQAATAILNGASKG